MYNTVTLSNNIRVVYEKIPFVRSISCGIWVGNGSRHEDEKTNGISHFIEHMLFKGTKTRTAKDIADQMDQIGGQVNAFTSKEYTCYYARTLYNHFDISIEILADMFLNSVFEESEIDKERNVIMEEIDMYEDTPEDLVHDILQYNVFKGDSLGYSVLGTKESLKSFNRDTFINYFKNNYHEDNIIIAVAGMFEEKDLIEKLEKYFGHYNTNKKFEKPKFNAKYNPCIITKAKEIEQIHLCMSFPSIKRSSKLSYDLTILNTIFGGGMSSRLFQTIREENGLSYSVYSYSSSYHDTGLFNIYSGLNQNQLERVIELIIEEVKKLFSNKITNDQLMRTKEQIKSNYLLSLESSSSRMNSIGRSKLLLDRILTPDEIIEKIDKVSLETIYELAEKIFDFDKLSLSAVGNIDNINFKGLISNGK